MIDSLALCDVSALPNLALVRARRPAQQRAPLRSATLRCAALRPSQQSANEWYEPCVVCKLRCAGPCAPQPALRVLSSQARGLALRSLALCHTGARKHPIYVMNMTVLLRNLALGVCACQALRVHNRRARTWRRSPQRRHTQRVMNSRAYTPLTLRLLSTFVYTYTHVFCWGALCENG